MIIPSENLEGSSWSGLTGDDLFKLPLAMKVHGDLGSEPVPAAICVEGYPVTLVFQTTVAKIQIRERRYVEAEKIARDVFEVETGTLRPQHPYTLETMQALGTAMVYLHHYFEAAEMFRDAIEKGVPGSHANQFQSCMHLAAWLRQRSTRRTRSDTCRKR